MNHLAAAQMYSSPDQSMTFLFAGQVTACQVVIGSFFMSAPVRRTGCGALLFSTDSDAASVVCLCRVIREIFIMKIIKTDKARGKGNTYMRVSVQ